MDNTRVGRMAILAFILAGLATILGIRVAGDNVTDADVRIGLWIQQWQGELPKTLESIGDMSGETPTAIAAVLGGIAIAALLRNWHMVGFFVAVGILRVIATGLKPIFESPRPVSSRLRIYEYSDGFGYPSGHSMTAAMIATMVVVIAWNVPGAARFRWLVTLLALVLGILVGWSRIWSGAHWPTDVLGGWSYGVALVLLAWVIATKIACSRIGLRWRR